MSDELYKALTEGEGLLSEQYGKSYDLLESQAEAQRSKYYDLLSGSLAQGGPKLTPKQALAQGLLAFLPSLIGYGLGKEQGALSGVKAGASAADIYQQGVQSDFAQQQKLDLLRAQDAKGKLDRVESLRDNILTSGLQQQFAEQQYQNRREDRLEDTRETAKIYAQYRGGGASDQSLSEEQKNYFSETLGVPRNILKTESDLTNIRLAKGAAGKQEDPNKLPSTTIPSLTVLKDEQGREFSPTKDERQYAQKQAQAFSTIYGNARRARDILLKYNGDYTTLSTNGGQDFVDFNGAINSIIAAVKTKEGYGANFSQFEQELAKAFLPPNTQLTFDNLSRAMRQKIAGVDAAAAMNEYMNTASKQFKDNLYYFKYQPGDNQLLGYDPSSSIVYESLKQKVPFQFQQGITVNMPSFVANQLSLARKLGDKGMFSNVVERFLSEQTKASIRENVEKLAKGK